MKRTVGIGNQYFDDLRGNDLFYIDKTDFIKEWWESRDSVTLITRPRRFGKTLNMSMLNCFFSNKYENRGDLFEGLSIWDDEEYRKLQGTYPVIFLSFANIKASSFKAVNHEIGQVIKNLYGEYFFLMEEGFLKKGETAFFERILEADGLNESDISFSLYQISMFLYQYYGKKVIILLDEYDTPMQEAYLQGYWEDMVQLIRGMLNSAFKTNPYLERAILTGITRVSKESIFSDLNNLNVVTTTSDEYADCFGFTEEEVFAAMDEYGYENKEEVKDWYDGFVFGEVSDIYNPWSIINFLAKGKYEPYWANTSENGLVNHLLQSGNMKLKNQLEDLIRGGTVTTRMDEQIVFSRLAGNAEAIWSLLVASGYLKILSYKGYGISRFYEIKLTNFEVMQMFQGMIREWFLHPDANYSEFVDALLVGNLRAMNRYMNDVALTTFSFFDAGNRPSGQTEPERFYHGFVLGLLVELGDRYEIRSNRESGFGRYDVMMIPKESKDDAVILEFKVQDTENGEESLGDTVKAALEQIEEKKYEQELIDRGIKKERIRKYGFAFQGKTILIGCA